MSELIFTAQTNEQTNRVEGLDSLKAICAFMVVCIHAPFPGKAGEYIVMLSAIAVPIFFMITGYFWHGIAEKNKEMSILGILTPLLLLIQYVFGTYSMALFGKEFPAMYFRNFIDNVTQADEGCDLTYMQYKE